ncbi:MAG: hypothetical protein NTX17_00285 [Candidatus Eisenbacteria bacterium]|nr:hypothetical protein [Candidatus Eisenbacteria bacterium]
MRRARGYADFLRDLSGRELPHVYFFSGTEAFLKREALRKLVEMVLPREARLLNHQSFSGADCSWGDVEVACLSSPLFSEKRVVALVGVDVMGEADVSGLLEYSRRPCKSTSLVLMSSSQGDEARKKGGVSINRLLGALEGSAATYAFWQNDRGDAHTWAGDWLKGNGKTMKESLLREVLDSVGHSCYETWNILEKAGAVACNCEEITAEHVSLVGGAASVGSTNSFRMAVAAADRDAAHTQAARCLDAGIQPTVLLWMLNRSFRDALTASGGSGVERVAWRDNAVVGELARRFNESEMCQAISFLYETERGIKTGVLEPELAIELLINELTR